LQQWRLELYPQREGRYRVPPVSIELAINDAEAGVVRGSLQTRAQVFEAGIPAVLQDIPVWLATPAFSADSTLDREPVALQPGDAFTRTIELQATSTAAMMLPEVTPHEVPGLAAYPELPELDNRSNRGEATAIRRQRITYVVERAGQYRLPEQTFYWWNTEQGRAERTSLAAVAIDAGSVPAATPGDIAARPWMLWAAAVVAAAAAATLLAAVFLWARRRGPASAPSEAELASRARRALRRGDAAAVASALYAWLNARAVKPGWLSLRNTVADLGDPEAVAATEKLLESAYGGREGGQSALGALRRALGSADRRRRKRGRQEMNLNPAQPRK